MKVALVSPYPREGAAPTGGVELNTVRLARALTHAGVGVTVVAPGSSGRRREDAVRVLGVDNAGRFSLARGHRPLRRSVARVLHELRADVVHGHGLAAAGLAATDVHGSARIVTAHGRPDRDARAAYGATRSVRAALAARLALRCAERADAVVGVHPDWRINMARPPRRLVHIPPIVDEAFFEVEHTPRGAKVVYCGGERAIKGWPTLLAAWPRVVGAVPRARLSVLGWSSPNRPSLNGTSASVRFAGPLPPAELAAELATASVVVIPSDFEVAPTILAESWAAGVPVVATAVGGVPGLATGAATLVPPRNPAALAAAIADALEQPDTAAVGTGRARAERWRAESAAAAHVDLYRAVSR